MHFEKHTNGHTRRLCFVCALVLLVCLDVAAQEGKVVLGLHYQRMLPNPILNVEQVVVSNDMMEVTMSAPGGMGFGMPIRWGISRIWSFETGIFYTRRDYTASMEDLQGGFTDRTRFSIIAYELPVKFLVNIPFTDLFWVNVGGGTSFDFFPSAVASSTQNIAHVSFRSNWIQMSLLGSLGFEFRTEKDGIFYLGGSFHQPFTDITISQVSYQPIRPAGPTYFVNIPMSGTYFSLDFRYYFPYREEKPKKRISP